jgi:phosphoglycolate phosphatase
MRPERALLLDLDGTLVDPAPGIIGSCRHALAELGRPAEADADLSWIIGPPLRGSFQRLLGGAEQVEAAVALYSERYASWGLGCAEVYPGVPEALRELRDEGFELLLCTSKAAVFARQVVERFGLADHLAAVYGAELDGRFDDKGELIAHILATDGRAAAQVCMVGDREQDMRGAARNKVEAIGVLWGYGSAAELGAAGAACLARTPGELSACARAVFAAKS